MTFSPEQIKMLQAPLDPINVKPPPRGKYGEYVDGHHVLSEANRIFGFDGWGYAITSMALCCRVDAKDKDGGAQVRVGYSCTVRAIAGGVDREGSAVGSGMAKPENEADAHESAIKEAETDALKRALRSFGNTFGLALYDKTKADVQSPEPEPPALISPDDVTRIMVLLEGNNIPVSELLAAAKVVRVPDIPASRAPSVMGWIERRITPTKKAE